MTLTEKEADISPELITKPPAWRIFLVREISPFVSSLRSVWFWASLATALLLFVLAYQLPFIKRIDLDAPRDRPLLVDYYAVERYEDFVYRWVQPSSNLIMPGVGQLSRIKVTLEISPRPPEYTQPTIEVSVNGLLLGTITPEKNTPPTSHTLELNIPSRNALDTKNGTLNLWLNMEGFFAKADRRPLGVVVSGIVIEAGGLTNTGRPTIPALPEVAMLLAALALTFVLGRRVGWDKSSAASGVLFFALLLTLGLALDRPTVGLSTPLILQSILICYPLAVGGWWFSGWVLQRRNIAWAVPQLRWLVVIFAFAFVIRVVGMNNPSFQVLDHGFRVNEVLEIKQNPSLIFSRYYNRNTFEGVGEGDRSVTAGQWGLKVTIPYTPLFYLLDLPIAWLTPDRNTLLYWTNVLGAWFDVSAIFFLYLIARTLLGRFGQVAGTAAATLYCFFPLSYLMVSDGGFNSIVAHWFTLAYLLALTRWLTPDLPKSWAAYTQAGFLLTMTFMAHTATLLLVGMMLFVFILMLFFWQKGKWRGLAKAVGLQWLSALGVAFALYYSFYLVGLITQTLPTILGAVGSGKQVGSQFLGAAVRGFFPSLWAHFYFIPFVIALVIPARLLFPLRPIKVNTIPAITSSNKVEITTPTLLLYLSWLLTFLLFSVAAEAINLLQKHMLFTIPFVALGCGLALAMLTDYFKPALYEKPGVKLWSRLVITLIQVGVILFVLYFVATGTYTWYIRVINYILPAGTG